MKSIIFSAAVIGTVAFVVGGVGGVAVSVSVAVAVAVGGKPLLPPTYTIALPLQSIAQQTAAITNPLNRLDHQAPASGPFKPSTNLNKRTCWEAINGQIQCNSPDATGSGTGSDTTTSPAADSSSSTGTSTMDNGDGTPVMVNSSGAEDDNDSGVGGDDTTCVHTADGFIRCGDVVGKRDVVGFGENDVEGDEAGDDDGGEHGSEEDSGVGGNLLARASEESSAMRHLEEGKEEHFGRGLEGRTRLVKPIWVHGCHGNPKPEYKDMKAECLHQLELGDKHWAKAVVEKCFAHPGCVRKRNSAAVIDPGQRVVEKREPKEWGTFPPRWLELPVVGERAAAAAEAPAAALSKQWRMQLLTMQTTMYTQVAEVERVEREESVKWPVPPPSLLALQEKLTRCRSGWLPRESERFLFPKRQDMQRSDGQNVQGIRQTVWVADQPDVGRFMLRQRGMPIRPEYRNVPDDQRHYDRNLIDTCFTNPNCPKRDVGPQIARDYIEKRESQPVADPKKGQHAKPKHSVEDAYSINFSGTSEQSHSPGRGKR
ncbi:MAG: hypothetical protein Q9207_004011 [Kuettlingeria erythrocarpa]